MRYVTIFFLLFITAVANADDGKEKGCLEQKYIDFIMLQKEYYRQVLEHLKEKSTSYYDALYPKFNYQQLVNKQRSLIFHYYLKHDTSHIRFDKPVYSWVRGLSHKNQDEWDELIKNEEIAKSVTQIEKSKSKIRNKHESYADANSYLKNMVMREQEIEKLKKTVYDKGHEKVKQLDCH